MPAAGVAAVAFCGTNRVAERFTPSSVYRFTLRVSTLKPLVSVACSRIRLATKTNTAAKSATPRLLIFFLFIFPLTNVLVGGLRNPCFAWQFYYTGEAAELLFANG